MLVEANVACCSVPFLFNCMCPNLHYPIDVFSMDTRACLLDRQASYSNMFVVGLQLAMTKLECSGSSYLVRSKTLSSCLFVFYVPGHKPVMPNVHCIVAHVLFTISKSCGLYLDFILVPQWSRSKWQIDASN